MRLSRTLLALLIVGALSPVARADAPWVDLVRTPEGFQASLPGTAKEESSYQDTAAGKVKTTTWSVSVSDTTYFAINRSEFPADIAKSWIPATVLEGSQSGALANVNGTLRDEKVIMLNDATNAKLMYPGREFSADVPQGMVLHARLYLIGSSLYQIMLVSAKGEDSQERWNKFAESFKLLAAKAH